MNKQLLLSSAISLTLFSPFSIAASVTTTSYSTGDTLTAASLNNNNAAIKTAVDDNDARLTTNANNAATNTTNISTNNGGIATNTTNISTNNGGIATNTTDISTNNGIILQNTSDISTNTGRLDTLESNTSRFGGDGSAGALTASTATNLDTLANTKPNFNFTNITIDAGQTLTVSAGTIIRCSGTFTNNGILSVRTTGLTTSYSLDFSPNAYSFQNISQPERGDAIRAARNPEGASALGVFLSGGSGGAPIPKSRAASAFNRLTIGGGSGGGSQSEGGGAGGGLVNIQCRGAIVNNSELKASGQSGAGGGGGGGIVILQSRQSITNTASGSVISVNGGNGINSQGNNGIGGGGGGGIIIMVAPIIDAGNLDTSTPPLNTNISLTGGIAGIVSTITAASTVHSGGGGGGASGGFGGNGGSVSSTNSFNAASAGSKGYILEIKADPAFMSH